MLDVPFSAAQAPSAAHLQNAELAARLREYADLIGAHEDAQFRARAYRRAAETIEALARPVAAVLAEEGREGLDALPGIGPSISSALAELVRTGRWTLLERARGGAGPEALFRTVPGIGPKLADRLAHELHLASLEALEAAAYDGTLASAARWGPRRLQMVRDALAQRLGRPRMQRLQAKSVRPPVAALLELDRDYRLAAEADRLPKVAPRRFNPQGEAWLPILHAERGAWRLTALYSNTPLAHQLGRTRDWVVIHYEADRGPEGQCTVVTETHGPLKGRRVVRGREGETPAADAPGS